MGAQNLNFNHKFPQNVGFQPPKFPFLDKRQFSDNPKLKVGRAIPPTFHNATAGNNVWPIWQVALLYANCLTAAD